MSTIQPETCDKNKLSVVDGLKHKASRIVSQCLEGYRDVVLLDFPNHVNVGDNAIWLGEIALLSTLGIKIHYVADIHIYSEQALRKCVKDFPILIHGGGNMGSVWPQHEKFRQMIVEKFRSNKIIQLPQTVHYDDSSLLESAKKIYGAHPDFTILARDLSSFDFCSSEFAAKTILCPDMAFCIGSLQPKSGPSAADIVLLLRKDVEAGNVMDGLDCLPDDCALMDWGEGCSTILSRFAWFLIHRMKKHPAKLSFLRRPVSLMFNRLAKERMQFGCKMISSGKVVITDRLHGHILCLLLGKPHVVLDNSYGKIRRYYSTWTSSSAIAAVGASLEDAIVKARQYIAKGTF